METDWDDLLDDFGWAIADLQPREFLIIDYLTPDIDLWPYAQVAHESNGLYYCEVASTYSLPEEFWPIDELLLAASGWEPPWQSQANWSQIVDTSVEAVHRLVDALRRGRSCPDPARFIGTRGKWSPPPDWPEPEPSLPWGPFDLAA